MEKALFVRAEWDEEAKVWVATSDDVPGLVAEADTAETLLIKSKIVEGEYANHCQSHGNIGLCHMFLGETTEALAALDRALEIDPNYEPAFQNRELLLSLPAGETISGKKAAIVDYYRDVVRKVGQIPS